MFDGNALKRLREDKGMSPSDLAGHVGISRQMVHLYESGASEPRYGVAMDLARALGVEVKEFDHDAEPATPEATRG